MRNKELLLGVPLGFRDPRIWVFFQQGAGSEVEQPDTNQCLYKKLTLLNYHVAHVDIVLY